VAVSREFFQPRNVQLRTCCCRGLPTCRRYDIIAVSIQGGCIYLHVAVQSSNCSTGEFRIKNESSEARGRLEFCDNQVWFAFRYVSSWRSAQPTDYRSRPWNSYLVCTSLGYSGIGQYEILVGSTAFHDPPPPPPPSRDRF
jgi:hypothetical protein